MPNKGFITDAPIGSESFNHKMKALKMKIEHDNHRNVPHEYDTYICPVTGISVSIAPAWYEGGISVLAETEPIN
jgi:hypothetical protein